MTNVKTEMKSTQLIITIDLDEDNGPSKSGKTTIVASTQGAIPISYKGSEYKLNLNVYKPRK
ncbi:MAG: hypothetical protein ACE5I1_03885 [bacterium]